MAVAVALAPPPARAPASCGDDAGASCGTTVAGGGEAQAEVDEQPTGSDPGCLGDAVAPRLALFSSPWPRALTEIVDPIPSQRLDKSRVLVHNLLLVTSVLVTRIAVTRVLVNALRLTTLRSILSSRETRGLDIVASTPRRIGIVGAGILGLAVARRLTELVPEAELTVVDKERDCALHQTGHNSGVMHAGVYYPQGSLKATLCRRGIDLLKCYCDAHGVPYDECGKVIVARDELEVPRLDEIERRARANGVPGLRRLNRTALTEVEPHVTGVSGLHSPSTAIVDFRAVAEALAAELERSGVTVRFGFEVTAIDRSGGEIRIEDEHAGETMAFDRAVLCGGLQSDRLARLAGDGPDPVIVPFRGEYHRLLPSRSHLVRGLIYPVPDPAFPFLGVHFTRRIDGTVDIGPNAVLALAREGYRRRDVSVADARDIIASPGFRRLARRHWRVGLSEVHGSLSRRAFVAEAQTFVPELRPPDVVPARAGVRAQAIDPDGTLVDDFRITDAGGIIVVRNAPSPAATSSLAIAEYVAPQVLGRTPAPLPAPGE